MLTVEEVRAHEAKLTRIVLGTLLSVLLLFQGIVLWARGWENLGRPFSSLGMLGVVVYGWRQTFYVMRDLRLRGRSPLWVFGLGGIFGFVAWLIWRKAHPIPTKFMPPAGKGLQGGNAPAGAEPSDACADLP